MSQCVPRLDLDDNFVRPLINTCAHSSSSSYLPPDVPSLDYQVTELACENEQPAMHGLRPSRVTNKPTASDSPTHAAGTLESIVNQATRHQPQPMAAMDGGGDNADELVRWLQRHPDAANPAADAVTMDALVPCDNINKTIIRNKNQEHASSGAAIAAAASLDGGVEGNGFARVGMSSCGTDGSASESATCGEGESRQLTLDSYEGELGGTWTSLASPENIISGREYTKTTAGDDLDSVSHSRPQWDKIGDEEGKKGTGKISVSNKRSRAAANHNQSERKRRDRINQRINTLQKMVPNSSKTDKASMLDEVIEYLKKLQAQVHMMSMSPMMLPLPMQQQLHMSMMMAGMGMRMGMGVMDMNDIGRWVPPVISPAAFKMADNSRDRLPAAPPGSMVSDPFPAFLTYQSQPTSMDAYRRLAALYQQQFQQQAPAASASKN